MKKIFSFLIISILMVSCNPTPTTVPVSVAVNTPSPTSGRVLIETGIPTYTITPIPYTRTPVPSYTPRPTNTLPTPTPTLTVTPTFDLRFVVTATRAPAAVCPEVQLNPPDLPFWVPPYYDALDEDILDYVNKYGYEPLINRFKEFSTVSYDRYFLMDLTNDGVPEFGFSMGGFYILQCINGFYEIRVKIRQDGFGPPYHQFINDINHDGIPEIFINYGMASQGGMGMGIIEWNGYEFRDILVSIAWDGDEVNSIAVEAGTEVFLEDYNHDGYDEVVYYEGIPIWAIYLEGLPWRRVKNYYQWNGFQYRLLRLVYDPPQYRYQAVQDADYESLLGEYETALGLYQTAIFSDTLQPWSPEWKRYESLVWQISNGGSSTPRPYPTPPAADPDEYYNLSAYARYRIMLLHVVRGYLPEAEIVYNTLQEKYPEGQSGHIFAELAQEFWDVYVLSQNMEQSCSAAIQYAWEHKDTIFYYISSDYHGWQSRNYEPGDVCPFK